MGNNGNIGQQWALSHMAEPKMCNRINISQSYAEWEVELRIERLNCDHQVGHLLLHADHAWDGLCHGRARVRHHGDHGWVSRILPEKENFQVDFSNKQQCWTSIFREVFTGFVVFSSYAVAITCVTPVREVLKSKTQEGFYGYGLFIQNMKIMPYIAHHTITHLQGRVLHLQPAGELCGRPLPPCHCLLWGHCSQLVLWTQVQHFNLFRSPFCCRNFSEDVYAMLGSRPGAYLIPIRCHFHQESAKIWENWLKWHWF